jgi:hypothetical protein
MNYLEKELVRSFDWTDYGKNRSIEKRVKINGRVYYKQGDYTVTSIVGDLYRVYDHSQEQFNYVMLIGVARQHPNDEKISFAEGIEKAALNAKMNPDMVLKFAHKVNWEYFRELAENYVYNYLPKELIRTKEEIQANQKS